MRKQLLSPFKALWYKSWTKFLGWCQGISGAGLFTLSQLNSYVSDPTFKSYLDMVDVPKSVTVTLAAIGIITWLAHGRKN